METVGQICVEINNQGTTVARSGVAQFKTYLADPATEFKSALNSALSFIAMAAAACTYLGAIAELLRHVVEGLVRHKDCPEDLLDQIEAFLRKLLAGSGNPYPKVGQQESEEQEAQLRFLAEAMVEGVRWSKEPLAERPVRLDVYFVGTTPWLAASDDATKHPDEQTASSHAGSKGRATT